MTTLAQQLQVAIQQDYALIAYGILYAINTNQYDSTANFEDFMESGFIARNIEGINDIRNQNPLQLGLVKLYAVPSIKNAPAINLYLARNLYEVKQLHTKQPEYERGKSRIHDISEWLNLEVDINNDGTFKSLSELKNEAQAIPCFIGTLSEGLIGTNGLPINLNKKKELQK